MSDDYFFGDEDFDNSAFIAGLDAFEATHNLQQPQQVTESAPAPAPVATRPVFRPPSRPAPALAPSTSRPKPPPAEVINISDDDEYKFGDSFDLENANWEEFDQRVEAEAQQPQRRTSPVPGPSAATTTRQFTRTSSGKLQQQTLWGLPAPPENRNKLPPRQKGKTMKKTKTWDRTEYAKTGWRVVKKRKNNPDEEEKEEEQEEVEFEQFPRPSNLAVGPPPPMKLTADRTAAETWVYPLNRPKRDYQFNIVQRCLFDNTLVALPTGLGKTFIAGCVMLNFYRWFPSGKVIFVAPSKPLVAQQIEACHKTCGIPGSDAAELTGEVTSKKRIEAWEEKRVFYMTPQTLMNDLLGGRCDPSKVILLVIDEAHKGRGNYAYAQIIRELMHKNPHFRVLALTATPGSKPDDVQELCDALHISHIEIRDEFSSDLKQYIFQKEVEQHIINMSGEILETRSLLAALMEPFIKTLQSNGVLLGNPDPVKLHPFRCQAEMQSLKQSVRWTIGTLSTLGKLARAMGYLCEESVGMCYDLLKTIEDGSSGKANPQKKPPAITKDQKYKDLMRGLEMQKEVQGRFQPHPKMEKLKSLVLEHFLTKGATDEASTDTRVMVFVSFRDCVEEVVDYLNFDSPIVKATKFVGQGTDKGGRKGYAQKEQLAVIQKFKAGEFNLLVATSIGEEGLDIGEIDLIVCYDAQKTPVRMLQRIGRTGRKREGRVHVLLAQGREEANWDKAQDTYQRVQHLIVNGDQLELFGDVDRLVPDDIDPACKEQIMEIEEYVREKPKARGSRAADSPTKTSAAKKRKRNRDPGRNIPDGASREFVPVSKLIEMVAKERHKDALTLDDAESLKSDDDDRDLEENLSGLKRTTSDAGPVTGASKSRKKPLKRSKTTAGTEKRKRTAKSAAGKGKKSPAKSPTKRKKTEKVTDNQVDQVMEDDEDDEALEEGIPAHSPPPANQKKLAGSVSSKTRLSPDASGSLSRDSDPPSPAGSPLFGDKSPTRISLSPSPPPRAITPHSVSPSPPPRCVSLDPIPLFLPDSSQPQVIDSPPGRSLSVSRDAGPSRLPSVSNPTTVLGDRSLSPASQHDGDGDMSWLVEEDDRDNGFIANDSVIDISSSPVRIERSSSPGMAGCDNDASVAESSKMAGKEAEYTKSEAAMTFSSPQPVRTKHAMLPPPVPLRVGAVNVAPESTFPVRPMLAKRQAKRKAPTVEDDVFGSSPRAGSPPRRLRQRRSRSNSPPPGSPLKKKTRGVVRKGKEKSKRDKTGMLIAPEWVEKEAMHSGDEISDGAISGAEDQSENEYDREFVNDFPSTQVSPSYNQTRIYRESLLTQIPRERGPAFARGPMRRKPFGNIDRRLPQHSVSSSPPRDLDEGPDEYERDSFVVSDDAEISYTLSSDI